MYIHNIYIYIYTYQLFGVRTSGVRTGQTDSLQPDGFRTGSGRGNFFRWKIRLGDTGFEAAKGSIRRRRLGGWSTANLPTNIMEFRGFDSSITLILRSGILMSIGNFPESLSQAILAGIMLVGRLGV